MYLLAFIAISTCATLHFILTLEVDLKYEFLKLFDFFHVKLLVGLKDLLIIC